MDIDEHGKHLKLWVRRKKTGLKLICSGCGQHVGAGLIHEVCEREVRDLPCFEYTTTVVVETYRVKCPRCGIRAEKVASKLVTECVPPALFTPAQQVRTK